MFANKISCKKRKKRDAGHPVLAPDVLLEIYRHSAIIGREAYVTKGNISYNWELAKQLDIKGSNGTRFP
jgi:hypothetical protein